MIGHEGGIITGLGIERLESIFEGLGMSGGSCKDWQ